MKLREKLKRKKYLSGSQECTNIRLMDKNDKGNPGPENRIQYRDKNLQ